MKKLTLFVSALVISTLAFSQDVLTGPRLKNAQIGKVIGPRFTLVHDSQPSSLKGPLAKNSDVWMGKSSKKFKVGFRDEINNPQGLQAKNSNPWDKPTPKVETKAVYEVPKSMRPKKGWIH